MIIIFFPDGTPIKNNTRCIKLILSAYLNLSLCYLKTEEYELAKDNALKALEIEPDNEKAHYRCGQAFLKLHDYKKAKHHFELCLSIEPKNKEAKNQLHQCVSEEKKQIEAERKRLMKMFEKFVDLEISFQRDPGNKKWYCFCCYEGVKKLWFANIYAMSVILMELLYLLMIFMNKIFDTEVYYNFLFDLFRNILNPQATITW